MALLVAYSDSDESDSDNDQSQSSPTKKRTFAQMNEKEKDSNSDSDESDEPEPNKKRKKIKSLPSAEKALKTKCDVSKIKELKQAMDKEQKLEKLILDYSKNKNDQKQGKDDRNSKYERELKKNELENKKYIKQQLKVLHEAKKENKFKKLTQETNRQKNSRKQKLGQAKFTLKWDRDCGSELAGI